MQPFIRRGNTLRAGGDRRRDIAQLTSGGFLRAKEISPRELRVYCMAVERAVAQCLPAHCLFDSQQSESRLIYAFREAMKGEHVSLRYEKLLYGRGETCRGTLFVHSDSGTHTVSDASARIVDAGGRVTDIAGRDIVCEIDTPSRSFTVECMLAGRIVNRYLFFVTDEAHPYADRSAVKGFFG